MIVRGELNNVAGGSEVTVLTYTNTTGSDEYVRGIGMEGNARAEWRVLKNLATIYKRRITSPEPIEETDLFDLRLQNNDILSVKVTHPEPFLAEFSADAIITPTKESTNIIIVRNTFLSIDLKGQLINESKLDGRITNISNLNGNISNISNLVGQITNTNSLSGVLENGKDLIGVVNCV